MWWTLAEKGPVLVPKSAKCTSAWNRPKIDNLTGVIWSAKHPVLFSVFYRTETDSCVATWRTSACMRFLKAWTMFYVTSVAKNMIFPSRLFFAKPCLRVTRRLTRVFHLTHFRKPFFQNGHVVKRAQNGGAVRLKRRAALRFLSFSSFWNSQSNTLYIYRYIHILI